MNAVTTNLSHAVAHIDPLYGGLSMSDLKRVSLRPVGRGAAAPLNPNRNHNRRLSALSLRNCYEKREVVAPRDLLGCGRRPR